MPVVIFIENRGPSFTSLTNEFPQLFDLPPPFFRCGLPFGSRRMSLLPPGLELSSGLNPFFFPFCYCKSFPVKRTYGIFLFSIALLLPLEKDGSLPLPRLESNRRFPGTCEELPRPKSTICSPPREETFNFACYREIQTCHIYCTNCHRTNLPPPPDGKRTVPFSK